MPTGFQLKLFIDDVSVLCIFALNPITIDITLGLQINNIDCKLSLLVVYLRR